MDLRSRFKKEDIERNERENRERNEKVINENKTKTVKLKLFNEDHDLLKKRAKENKKTMAQYLRIILNIKLKTDTKIISDDDRKKIIFLNSISNNINQIAKKLNENNEKNNDYFLLFLDEMEQDLNNIFLIEEKKNEILLAENKKLLLKIKQLEGEK